MKTKVKSLRQTHTELCVGQHDKRIGQACHENVTASLMTPAQDRAWILYKNPEKKSFGLLEFQTSVFKISRIVDAYYFAKKHSNIYQTVMNISKEASFTSMK